jgi:hypothetical protein
MFRRREHELSCQRCGGTFRATRSDARFCSRGCRRRHDATPAPAAEPAVLAAPGVPWRRVGGPGVSDFTPWYGQHGWPAELEGWE